MPMMMSELNKVFNETRNSFKIAFSLFEEPGCKTLSSRPEGRRPRCVWISVFLFKVGVWVYRQLVFC